MLVLVLHLDQVNIADGWRESWVDFILQRLRIALVVVDVMIVR